MIATAGGDFVDWKSETIASWGMGSRCWVPSGSGSLRARPTARGEISSTCSGGRCSRTPARGGCGASTSAPTPSTPTAGCTSSSATPRRSRALASPATRILWRGPTTAESCPAAGTRRSAGRSCCRTTDRARPMRPASRTGASARSATGCSGPRRATRRSARGTGVPTTRRAGTSIFRAVRGRARSTPEASPAGVTASAATASSTRAFWPRACAPARPAAACACRRC